MPRIAVFNQKGGVGKTTTVLNLAGLLARRGRDPLVLDLDPRAHLTAICGVIVPRAEASVYGVYSQGLSLSALSCPTRHGWQLVPSHIEMSKVDVQYGKVPSVLTRIDTAIERDYAQRVVLMDTCPMLGVLSLSSIFSADGVIIPISTDYLAMKTAIQMERMLKAMEHVVKKRAPRRYLITRYDARRKMAVDIERQLRERFGDDVCATRIAENVSLAESPATNQDVFEHAPDSRGARHYTELLDELTVSGFLDGQPRPVPGLRVAPAAARNVIMVGAAGDEVRVAAQAGLRLVRGANS